MRHSSQVCTESAKNPRSSRARSRTLTSAHHRNSATAPTSRPLAATPAVEMPPATYMSPPTTLWAATAAGRRLRRSFVASRACFAHPSERTRRTPMRPTPCRSEAAAPRAAAARPAHAPCSQARDAARTERRNSAPAARRPQHAGGARSSIATARQLRTCRGVPHHGMAARRLRLHVCSRCALLASGLRISPPERKGELAASAALGSAAAAYSAAACRIGDALGAR